MFTQPSSRSKRYLSTRTVALIVGACVTFTLAVGQASASTPAPIQGTWNFGGGQVLVQPQSSGGFIGTVVQPTTFGSCSHPVGQVIWNIQGSGLDYTGTHLWNHANCTPNPGGQSKWTISDTDPTTYTLTFCTSPPGDGPPNPAATPSNSVGGTQCFNLTRQLSPGETPPAPANTQRPTISGTAKATDTLTCSTGTWTNAPTAYDYTWDRNGTPISGATHSTYVVQAGDEGLKLTCTVIAFNGGGAGPAATSLPVAVPVPVVARCPAASGSLSGTTLGHLRLGMTRRQARNVFVKSSDRGKKYEDFFCLTPIGVRVGYASPALLKTLSTSERKRVAGRVVLALTSNGFYALGGIRPGAKLTAGQKRFPHGSLFHVGLNYWYIAPNGGSSAVFKVRKGLIEEVGVAIKQLTARHQSQRTFINSFS